MDIALLLAAAVTPPPAPPKLIASDFDLARVARPSGCKGSAQEIVVCGRKETARVRPVENIYAAKPIRAQVGLAGGSTLGVESEQKTLAAGQVSNRVMVRLKIPFGGPAKP